MRESEHESHPTAVDARRRPDHRDAVLCAVRVRLFAEFRVSVLRRSSVPGADVRLVRLWGSARPHNEPLAIPAWAASRVTVGRSQMPPPSQLEVVVFWITGIVVTILSGGVAIYASHHHLWG
jgi:hypothetical protein